MTRRRRAWLALTVAISAVVVTACGGDEGESASAPVSSSTASSSEVSSSEVSSSEESMSEVSSSEESMPEESMPEVSSSEVSSSEVSSSEESMSEESLPEETAELAAWQTIEIADVDGATFSLADYVGTPVLVETFATWCVKCRAQLGDTQQAAVTLGAEAAVVALSVETNLSSGDVAEYAADNGFADIRFAVMTPALLAAFADAFGTTVANPPSTPKVIIDAMGNAGDLSTGPESTDDLVTEVRAAAA